MIDVILPIRYLFKRRISYLAVLSVALCCFVVFVVMTVMNGLVGGFKEKIHRTVGDCVVGTDSLVGFPYYQDFLAVLDRTAGVAAASPVVSNYGFVTRSGRSQGNAVQILGIDPNRHSQVTRFGESLHRLRENPSCAFEPVLDSNHPGCVPGIDLVLYRNDRGEYNHHFAPLDQTFEITCFPLNAKGAPARAGAGDFNTKVFAFSDTSRSDLPKQDQRQITLALAEAQWLCGMDGSMERVSAIHITFDDDARIDEGMRSVAALWQTFVAEQQGRPYANLLDTVRVQDWRRFRAETIGAMEKEQGALILMFLLVGLTTVFIIFVVFYMIVTHKVKDIGILRSVGLGQRRLIGLFLRFALAVGVLGAGIGIAVGALFLRHANAIEEWLDIQVFDRSIYFIGELPNQVTPGTVLGIVGAAMVACLLGAALPVMKAARLRPVQTLQVNPL
ncbi:ABC transporter permease [Planctomycetota bacterium]